MTQTPSFWTAKHDFNGEESEDQLSFKKGETFVVIAQHEGGWFTAQRNGKTGYVPSNYLEQVKNEQPKSQQLKRSNSTNMVKTQPTQVELQNSEINKSGTVKRGTPNQRARPTQRRPTVNASGGIQLIKPMEAKPQNQLLPPQQLIQQQNQISNNESGASGSQNVDNQPPVGIQGLQASNPNPMAHAPPSSPAQSPSQPQSVQSTPNPIQQAFSPRNETGAGSNNNQTSNPPLPLDKKEQTITKTFTSLFRGRGKPPPRNPLNRAATEGSNITPSPPPSSANQPFTHQAPMPGIAARSQGPSPAIRINNPNPPNPATTTSTTTISSQTPSLSPSIPPTSVSPTESKSTPQTNVSPRNERQKVHQLPPPTRKDTAPPPTMKYQLSSPIISSSGLVPPKQKPRAFTNQVPVRPVRSDDPKQQLAVPSSSGNIDISPRPKLNIPSPTGPPILDNKSPSHSPANPSALETPINIRSSASKVPKAELFPEGDETFDLIAEPPLDPSHPPEPDLPAPQAIIIENPVHPSGNEDSNNQQIIPGTPPKLGIIKSSSIIDELNSKLAVGAPPSVKSKSTLSSSGDARIGPSHATRSFDDESSSESNPLSNSGEFNGLTRSDSLVTAQTATPFHPPVLSLSLSTPIIPIPSPYPVLPAAKPMLFVPPPPDSYPPIPLRTDKGEAEVVEECFSVIPSTDQSSVPKDDDVKLLTNGFFHFFFFIFVE